MKDLARIRNRETLIAILLGGFVFLGGYISFLGWPFNIHGLTDWFRDGVSIQPNACVLLMVSGAALLLVQWQRWRAVKVLGAIVGLGGVSLLLQHILGMDFGINHKLLFEREWGQNATVSPGRVGPPASVSFTLVGIALILLAHSSQHSQYQALRRFVPRLGLAVCVITAFSLLGYLFKAEQFYSIPWLTAIALQASIMLTAVAIGLIFSVPDHQPLLLLHENSGAGALARFTVPALIIMIPLMLRLRVLGHEREYYDLGTSRALGAIALMIGTFAILWVALILLRSHEQRLRQTIEELNTADRRKDEFLATLAHELRNPLAPVMNALTILDRVPGDDPLAGDARAIMHRQMRQMVRLIDDLLDVSRISRGKIELRKERVKLQSVFEQTIESITPLCETARQNLQTDLPTEPVWILADPVRLAQIVGNLLSNASRYSQPGSEISLQAECEGKDLLLKVTDQGMGIPEDKLESIFEMFSQVGSTPERMSEGLGIGLYLVRQLVHMHGGTVEAHSRGQGQGSTFRVRLPVVVETPETTQPAEDQQPADSQEKRAQRILIVDDNVDAAKTMGELLVSYNYEIHTVHDGQQAVKAAQHFNPEIVLLDIGLPLLDGFEVCKQIRSQPWGSQMLIIAVTGWGQAEHRRRAEESGFHAHLVKPVETAVLIELLQSFQNNGSPPAGQSHKSVRSKIPG